MYQSQVKTQDTLRNTKDGAFDFLAGMHDGIKDNSDRNIEEVTRLQLMVDDIKTHVRSNDYQIQSRMKMDDTQNISGFYGS